MADRPGLASRKPKVMRNTATEPTRQRRPEEYDAYASITNPHFYEPAIQTERGAGAKEYQYGAMEANSTAKAPNHPQQRNPTLHEKHHIQNSANHNHSSDLFQFQVRPPSFPSNKTQNPQHLQPGNPYDAQGYSFNPQKPQEGAPLVNNLADLSQNIIKSQITGFAANEIQDNLTKKIHEYKALLNLRYYFDITTTSVYKKIIIFIFPFFKKNWGRVYNRSYSTGQIMPLPPSADVNSPDLYIPAMTMITYIIMSGIMIKPISNTDSHSAQGASYSMKIEFLPESLIAAGTKVLAISIAETLFVKLALYLVASPTEAPWLDAYAICGYKYLSSIIIHFFKLLSRSNLLYYVIFLYVELCYIVFTMRTLKMYFVPQTGGFTNDTGYQRNILALLCIALVQVATSWWLTVH